MAIALGLGLVLGSGIAVLLAVYTYAFDDSLVHAGASFGEILLYTLPLCWLWCLAAPLVAFLGRRHPLPAPKWGRSLLFHLAASLVMATLVLMAAAAWIFLVSSLASRRGASYREILDLYAAEVYTREIFIYWVILGASLALVYFRKYRERSMAASRLEAELAKAQIQALRMQLQPHFLFNTLNSIVALVVKKDTDRAVAALHRLADFLRSTLEDSAEPEIPLHKELAFAEQYLGIEQVRFPDRLEVRWEVEAEALAGLVPHLLLQPLLENSLRYAVAQREAGGVIHIRARRRGSRLLLELSDNGPGVNGTGSQGTRGPGSGAGSGAGSGLGIGLANVRQRLAHLYGEDQSLRTEETADGGSRAILDLPYRPAPPPADEATAAARGDD
jgi:two-component system, LytTR family, sensor kinase